MSKIGAIPMRLKYRIAGRYFGMVVRILDDTHSEIAQAIRELYWLYLSAGTLEPSSVRSLLKVSEQLVEDLEVRRLLRALLEALFLQAVVQLVEHRDEVSASFSCLVRILSEASKIPK